MAIYDSHIEGNVSLKLTQFGLDLSPQACHGNVEKLVKRAVETKSFVRIDMESSEYTDRTLDLVTDLHARHGAVGTVIQAYLHRSRADIEMLNARGIRVRLCKGAYLEPASVAFPKKEDVDGNYVELMKLLLDKGAYPAIATHDEKMIEATKAYAAPSTKSRAMPSNSRCSTASAATCSADWWPRATACASTSRSARPGIRTTCVAWRNVRRMCFSFCGTCSGNNEYYLPRRITLSRRLRHTW